MAQFEKKDFTDGIRVEMTECRVDKLT